MTIIDRTFTSLLLLAGLLIPVTLAGAQDAEGEDAWGMDIGGTRWQPSAEARARGEIRNDPYTATANDLIFVTSRARIGIEGRLDPVRLFVQVQDARNFGAVGPGSDEGSLTGLHQGYLELHGQDAWLRLGRQEISYGHQRMIGAFGWSSAARSFDALRLHANLGTVELDLMGAYLRQQRVLQRAPGDNLPTDGDILGGVYVTWRALDQLTVEPYLLYRHDGPTEAPAGAADPAPFLGRDRDIGAYGVRLVGAIEQGLHYELEGIFEFGKVDVNGDGMDADTFRAYAVAGEVGYRVSIVDAFGGFAYGSGAEGPGASGDIDEFDNFFPTNHLFYGSADLFGLRNVIDGYVGAKLAFSEPDMTAELTFHILGFAEPGARWSNAGGGTIGVNAMNEERLAGFELDVNATWKPVSHFNVAAGYSLFIPGDGGNALDPRPMGAGREDPSHWAYVMAGVVFP